MSMEKEKVWPMRGVELCQQPRVHRKCLGPRGLFYSAMTLAMWFREERTGHGPRYVESTLVYSSSTLVTHT